MLRPGSKIYISNRQPPKRLGPTCQLREIGKMLNDAHKHILDVSKAPQNPPLKPVHRVNSVGDCLEDYVS
jgi:hypothetical protein